MNLPGMRKCARWLYYEAGVETIQQLAGWDPDKLRQRLERFVEESGFDGIAPYPVEVKYAVRKARTLPVVLELEDD